MITSISLLIPTSRTGSNLCTTIAALPAFLQSPPPLLAKQWKSLYDNGIGLIVPCAMGAAVGFAYLAFDASKVVGWGGSQVKLYVAAATAAFGLAPYTQIVMRSNIKRLTKIASSGTDDGRVGKVEVHELVRTWGTFNLIRGFLPLSAAVIGVWAVSEGRQMST